MARRRHKVCSDPITMLISRKTEKAKEKPNWDETVLLGDSTKLNSPLLKTYNNLQ